MLSPLVESSEQPKSNKNEETSGGGGDKSDCTNVAVDAGDDIFNLNSVVDKHDYNYLRGGKRKKEEEQEVLDAGGKNKKSTQTIRK